MNRDQIEQLLRMAHEIETLEASASDSTRPVVEHGLDASSGPFSFSDAQRRVAAAKAIVAAHDRSRRQWRSVVAAAAVVLLAGIAWTNFGFLSGPERSALPGPVAVKNHGSDIPIGAKHGVPAIDVPTVVVASEPPRLTILPAKVEPAKTGDDCAASAEPEITGIASRIMTFASDSDPENHCRCSQTVLHQWEGGRSLAGVTRAELLRIGFESSCIDSPDRLMVVAVSGPVQLLPSSDEQVAALAHCIDLPGGDDEIGYLGHDEVKYASAAMACMTQGLSVEVVTLLAR